MATESTSPVESPTAEESDITVIDDPGPWAESKEIAAPIAGAILKDWVR